MQHEGHSGVDLRRYRGVIEQARQSLRQSRADAQTPSYLDACVGREAELQQLQRWLSQPNAPLLTLTGVSGIGKTHLACECLKRAKQAGMHCIYVNLTLLQTADQILPAVFHALNTPFPEAAVWRQLAPYIFERGVLLVLDDFSGLLPEGARVLQQLIGAAPELKVLATSQEPLNIPGEETLPLALLPAPPPTLRSNLLEQLRHNPSVAIFLSQVGNRLQLSPSNVAEVARVCADLGGHPGNLVDAGLYLRHYSWTQFYSQYRVWFGLLPSGPLKPEAQRHRLYHMLREEERRILRSLLAFPDTFDAVAAAAAAHIDAHAIEPLLAKLQDQGFLQTTRESTRTCYRIRPQMRPVIPPLKETQQVVVMQRLHAYYRQQLQLENWTNQPDKTPRAWCFAERYTLQRVLEYLSEQGDTTAIAEMFQMLDQVCGNRPPAMLLDWGVHYVSRSDVLSLEQCVAIAKSLLLSMVSSGMNEQASQFVEILESSDESAAVLGRYWHNRGDAERAHSYYMKALTMSENRRDREEILKQAANLAESEAVIGNLNQAEQILRDLERRYPLHRMSSEVRGWYYYVAAYGQYQRGRFLRSRELYEAADRHGTRDKDAWRELSRVYLELGAYDKALDYASKTLHWLEADMEPLSPSVYAIKNCLGDIHAVRGDYDKAFAYHAPALEFWRERDQPRWLCWTLNRLAEIELLAREAEHPWRLAQALGISAQACLNEAWQVIEPTYMNLPHRSRTLHNLGWLAWHEGRLDEAEAYLNRALEIRRSYGNLYGVARTLEVLARVRFSQGRYGEAKALLRQASQIREQLDARPYPQIKWRNLSMWRRMRALENTPQEGLSLASNDRRR